jgi:Mn-dependent DtxR family transcriptional regulator
MRIVGEQYRRGQIRIQDAARLLGMSTSDAIFDLEQDGFSRAPAAVALTEDEREAVYQRLRQHRLQHTGPPVVDQELVERDVIASERIAGVDARSWMRQQ